MRRSHLGGPARAGLASLLTLLAGVVAAAPAPAGQSTTTMQVTVRVVDRCSVEAFASAAGPEVREACGPPGLAARQPPGLVRDVPARPGGPRVVVEEPGARRVGVVTLVY